MNAMRLTENEENFILLLAKVYESCEPDKPYITKEEARERLGISPKEMEVVLRATWEFGAYTTPGGGKEPTLRAGLKAIQMARKIEADRAEAARPDRVAQFWGWAHRNLLVAALIIIAGAAFCILGLVKLILGLIAFFRA